MERDALVPPLRLWRVRRRERHRSTRVSFDEDVLAWLVSGMAPNAWPIGPFELSPFGCACAIVSSLSIRR
jgi:hypothetical protein